MSCPSSIFSQSKQECYHLIGVKLEDVDERLPKGNLRYVVDGLGHTKSGVERVFMEGSSGELTVDMDKAIDDSVKQLSSLISMLKGIANSHLNANFDTLLATKVLGIQAIKTHIVLSEFKFKDDSSFTYQEMRSVELPAIYTQRNKLLKVFEILWYFFIAMKDHHVNYEALEDVRSVTPLEIIERSTNFHKTYI